MALQAAGLVADPLRGRNYANASAWAGPVWRYSTSFVAPRPAASALLVFDGIKMGASISLNGRVLGNATNQHRRYIFPLTLEGGSLPEGFGLWQC